MLKFLRKTRTQAATALLAGILVGTGGGAVYATIYTGGAKTWTAYGHPYVTRNAVDDVNHKSSTVHNVTSGNVGPGYMGTSNTLFKGTAVCASSNVTYNNATTTAWPRSSVGTCGGGGSYYSGGTAYSYVGTNVYEQHTADTSPFANW